MVDIRAELLRTDGFMGDMEAPAQERDAMRRAIALEILRSDSPLSHELRQAIADVFDVQRTKGQPKRGPLRWYQVGLLVDDGASVADAAAILNLELRTAQRGLAFFRACKAANDEAMRDI